MKFLNTEEEKKLKVKNVFGLRFKVCALKKKTTIVDKIKSTLQTHFSYCYIYGKVLIPQKYKDAFKSIKITNNSVEKLAEKQRNWKIHKNKY